jgi:hypothetical protein
MRVCCATYNSDEFLSGFVVFGVVRFVVCLFCLILFGLVHFGTMLFLLVRLDFLLYSLVWYGSASVWFGLVRCDLGLVCFRSVHPGSSWFVMIWFASFTFGLPRFRSVWLVRFGSVRFLIFFPCVMFWFLCF